MIAALNASRLPPAPGTPPPERQAFKDMAEALKSGNLDAARDAYADAVRNRPEGASWKPGSPFAQLGRALAQGDLDAARAAFAGMIRDRIDPPVRATGMTAVESTANPAPSSTGGLSGSVLNTVA